MKKRAWTTGVAALLLVGVVCGHGGIYRGPGDTVPPRGPGGDPTPKPPGGITPPKPGDPSGPVTPKPRGMPERPRTGTPPMGPPTPNQPRMPGNNPTTGVQVGPDLTEWTFWWEFNKDHYLRLKDRIRGQGASSPGGLLAGLGVRRKGGGDASKPAVQEVRHVATLLRRSLAEEKNRDLCSSALIALAKIGQDRELGTLLRRYVKDPDQEIGETALLACGIAGLDSSAADLVEVFLDTEQGRNLVKRTYVDYRRRSFAAYSLGLLAHRSRDLVLKRRVFQAARKVLDNRQVRRRDILVSALIAIRQLNPDTTTDGGRELAANAVSYLLDYFNDRDHRYQMRAHVPTAISCLVPPGSVARYGTEGRLEEGDRLNQLRLRAVKRFMGVLARPKENIMVLGSVALALGQMGTPAETALIKLLTKAAEGELTRDIQTRYYSFIALGTVGGRQARSFLLQRLARKGRQREKPWIGLALGLMANRMHKAGQADRDLVAGLESAFRRMRTPGWKGGLAIALGLTRSASSAVYLQAVFEKTRHSGLRGYCAVALGMIGDRGAMPALRRALPKSVRLPGLMAQLSIGLGLMGDRALVRDLVKRLQVGSTALAAQAALARGLGFIGDRRAINPLCDMLFNQNLAKLTRAFAAAALGSVADKDDLPWASRIARGLNYRANVETLTGSAAGILDLL